MKTDRGYLYDPGVDSPLSELKCVAVWSPDFPLSSLPARMTEHMNSSKRRRVLQLCGMTVVSGVSGCLRLASGSDEENDIQDTDGDGVIDSEDYAPQDPEIQREEQVSKEDTETSPTPTETTITNTEQPVSTGSEEITRTNSDGEIYQSGRVTESPETLSAGDEVSVTIEITQEIPKAADNIVYGAVGSSDGDLYGIKNMPGTGGGSVTVVASLPQDPDVAVFWTWVPATNLPDARSRASRSIRSKTDTRGEPIALQLGRTV